MKKIIIFLIVAMSFSLATKAQTDVWDGTAVAWTQGDGTQANPYLIQSAENLAYLANLVNNGTSVAGDYYRLMVDIDLNGSQTFQWTPIGNATHSFAGNFDGNNHTISNLFINTSILQYAGLFGTATNARIENLGIIGQSSITTSSYAGGIVGYNNSGSLTITNCYNTGNISSFNSGGIVGGCYYGTTTITNCYNTGNISFSSSGGIVGYCCYGTTTITNCYNTGNISSSYSSYSGGIVGYCNPATITNCFNIGNISNGGGGISNGGTVNNSYYLNTCGGNNTIGTPMASSAMQNPAFVTTLNNGGAAFVQDTIPYVNQGYPILNNFKYLNANVFSPTNVTRYQATLKGAVCSRNTNIVGKGFEYKVVGSANYTNVNAVGNDTIVATITGLLPGTRYICRSYVTSTNGVIEFYSDTLTFTTAAWNTNGNQYLIEDSADLILLAQLVADSNTFQGKSFLLVNDINLSIVPNNIRSIGSYPNRPFCGTFDGNGKLIYNVYIDKPNTEYQGFFGYTKNAYLYNVGLINITASGRNFTGGMVAYAENTDIRSSYVSGGTLFALSYVGGLVGYQTPGTNSIISGCYNTCQVSGNNNVGGLLGYSNNGTVRNSYVAGVVSGQGTGVGAIIGKADNVLSYNCYFSDSITGQTVAIGINNFSKSGEGNMSNSEMQTQSFVDMLNQGLATSVWRMDYTNHINNGFPILIWQSGTNGICGVNKDNSLALKLYPNPANSRTTLYVNGLKNNADIIIYDINGRDVKRLKINKSEKDIDIDIDLNGLSKGIYQVRVINNRISTTKKLIVR